MFMQAKTLDHLVHFNVGLPQERLKLSKSLKDWSALADDFRTISFVGEAADSLSILDHLRSSAMETGSTVRFQQLRTEM
jgi:hypothetical protein